MCLNPGCNPNLSKSKGVTKGVTKGDRVLVHAPEFLTSDEHEHNDEIRSMSFEAEKPIDAERFNARKAFAATFMISALTGSGTSPGLVTVTSSASVAPSIANATSSRNANG